ncbi:MAG TPA: hypothetical protein VFQ41_12130 [Candidatus Angelobacter sp.]|nr:hypothetical protein [Candidatus Angelobacter sp.]
MYRIGKGIIASILGICLAGTALAQTPNAPSGPPKVLVITREVIKLGQRSAHEKFEAGWPKAFTAANWPVHYLAMSSMSGESRALYITGYDSAEAWEKDNQAQRKNASLGQQLDALSVKDADFLKESRTGVFTFMPDISYNANVEIGSMRYFRIVDVQVKPGHNDHFVEVRKLVRAAHEKAGLKDHFAIYHLNGGGSTGMYLIMLPMKSLAEDDAFDAMHGADYKAALGQDGQKSLADFNMQGVESIDSELFEFSPKMSYPAKAWVDADPAFWTASDDSSPQPAAKKPPKK